MNFSEYGRQHSATTVQALHRSHEQGQTTKYSPYSKGWGNVFWCGQQDRSTGQMKGGAAQDRAADRGPNVVCWPMLPPSFCDKASPHLWNQLPTSLRIPHPNYSPPSQRPSMEHAGLTCYTLLSPSITFSLFHS